MMRLNPNKVAQSKFQHDIAQRGCCDAHALIKETSLVLMRPERAVILLR